jgi:hypothetical protein
MNAPRADIRTRLLGTVVDLLRIEAFSHTENQRAHWVCRCECGAVLVRSSATMNKNRARKRKNGCDTCVPSQRITVLNQVSKMTPEERADARARSQRKYEATERAKRSLSKRAKRWYEPAAREERIVDGAVIVSGKVVGQARTAKERAWFDWAFGE